MRLWYGRWDYKYLEAARHGVAGALLVHTTKSAGYPWGVVVSLNRLEGFALPPDADTPMSFKVIGALSLVSWFFVLYFGRMLAFFGTQISGL